MKHRSTDPLGSRELLASNSSKDGSSEGGSPTPSTASDPTESASSPTPSSGLFRQVLLAWFADSSVEEAFRQVGRMFEDLMAKTCIQEGPDQDPAAHLDARLQAIAADLTFLAIFLQEAIDVRQHSSLEPEDWELARTAGHEGAQLLALRDTLLASIPLAPESTPTAKTLEDFIGCRETALWPLPTPEDRQSIRTITTLLHGYAREVQVLEIPHSEPAIRRDARAVVVDLLGLAEFVVETAGVVGEEMGEPLAELAQRLNGAARGLVGGGEGAG